VPTTTTSPVLDVLDRIHVHDVDTHVMEPRDVWTSRISSKWGDLVPHVVRDEATGLEAWMIGDKMVCLVAQFSVAGWSEFWPSKPRNYEQAPAGAWQPEARLRWMDEQGVYSQILYPNLLAFYPNTFLTLDPELRLDCVRAYNDFQSEFCSTDPDRLIPLASLPWWDVEASVVELERCQAMGHKGVNLPWQFDKVGLPPLRDSHWEPLLKTSEEMGLSVNFHTAFNSGDENTRGIEQQVEALTSGRKVDSLVFAKVTSSSFMGNMNCIAELTFGRICHNYPTLKFVSVESGVGFVPYLLDHMDWQFQNTACFHDHPEMLLPSEYFRRQIYGSFWFERHLERFVDLYPDNFMFESDYPHPTSLSPGENTHAKGPRDTIVANLSGLSEELLVKVLQDNAANVYGLPKATEVAHVG
jgi:predicted TIM-barrel fold metal-dependent hydrolase